MFNDSLARGLRVRGRAQQVVTKLTRIPTWLEAIIVVLLVRTGLARLRYLRLLHWLEQSAQRLRFAKTARHDAKAQVVAAVDRARRYGVGRISCLEEALTIQWMLRRRNIATQVQIGVRRTEDHQLLGHAWVECAGEIISIDLYSPASYIVLAPTANGLPHESYRWNRSF